MALKYLSMMSILLACRFCLLFCFEILKVNQNAAIEMIVNMAEKINIISPAIDDAIFFFLSFNISNS